jgi:diguanylate cyclase (GGDEF)-like protein
MIRSGAQDFLAKTELDSLPLARSLRLAVERNKIVRDLRTHVSRDELTGLANRNGFDMFAERDLAMARHLGRSLAVILVDVAGLEELTQNYGRGEQQLALMELAEILRSCAGRAACIGHVSNEQFAISMIPVDGDEITTLTSVLARRFHLFQMASNRTLLRIRMGVSWYHPTAQGPVATPGAEHVSIADLLASAARTLCENKVEILASMVEKGNHLAAYANSSRRNI